MTPAWFESDDQLLEELRLARLEDAVPAPSEMLMTGYDIVMSDTLEADLLHDSQVDQTAAIRSDVAGARMLTYSVDGFEVEFEVLEGRIVGHIDPPQPGLMHLEQPTSGTDEPAPVEPDDLGAFEFELQSPSTFRLRFVAESGDSIATGWVDGPHPTIR